MKSLRKLDYKAECGVGRGWREIEPLATPPPHYFATLSNLVHGCNDVVDCPAPAALLLKSTTKWILLD